LKAWPILGITIIQALLLLAHWVIYQTLIAFCGIPGPAAGHFLRTSLWVLTFSFVIGAMLAFRFNNLPVRLIYRIGAVWLGFLSFLFWAACLCWIVWLGMRLLGISPTPVYFRTLFALAVVAGIYGLLNARSIRVSRFTVKLENLPESWRGRTALLFSDLHLGHINGVRFSRRIEALAASLRPDIVFVPGDLFDGTKVDPDAVIAPFRDLAPPFGVYFSVGNHEEFGNSAIYSAAITRAGIHVLSNEKVVVDGLQIAGVPYHDTTYPLRMKAILDGLRLDPSRASILLNHVPNRLPIVEQAGISLQLSGHTHGGQFFPYTWFTHRIFGKFTRGLHSFGALQVCTSYGAGTWGPPMRLGTRPEVILLTFA